MIDQGGHGGALVLHELGVHADGGEAGEGVDLVDHHPVGAVLHKEIAAGQALAVQGGVSHGGVGLDLVQLFLAESGRDDHLADPVLVLVVVLFGGMSSEHEVSRVSAGTFVDNLDRARYEVLTVGITREGRWLCTEATSAQMADGSWEELPGNMPCVISPDRADHGMILFTPSGQVEKLHVDVVIPALHGLWGEDGTVQGLLELAGIPYVGCGVLASAVCMDKAVANALFDAAGIPHTKWLSACRWEIESDLDGVCDGAIAKLGWPIFVKPANAGSSVGITKAHDRDELKQAIALALENDHKVVFEAFVDGHEVECAVIGSDPAVATRPGEILAGAEFYT